MVLIKILPSAEDLAVRSIEEKFVNKWCGDSPC